MDEVTNSDNHLSQVGLPLLGLMSTGEVAVNYLNSTNYMFLGGLIMAIAVEHCGLHNRVALKIIMMVRINWEDKFVTSMFRLEPARQG